MFYPPPPKKSQRQINKRKRQAVMVLRKRVSKVESDQLLLTSSTPERAAKGDIELTDLPAVGIVAVAADIWRIDAWLAKASSMLASTPLRTG